MSKKEMTQAQAQDTQAQEFSLAVQPQETAAIERMDDNSNFIVDLTSRTTQYCSMVAQTADEKAILFNAMTSKNKKASKTPSGLHHGATTSKAPNNHHFS